MWLKSKFSTNIAVPRILISVIQDSKIYSINLVAFVWFPHSVKIFAFLHNEYPQNEETFAQKPRLKYVYN